MKLKTSTALSLKFTLYVTVLLLLLGFFVNGWFFLQWWRGEQFKLQQQIPVLFQERQQQVVTTIISPSQVMQNNQLQKNDDRIREKLSKKTKEWKGQRVKKILFPEDESAPPWVKKIIETKTTMMPVRMPMRDNIMILPFSGHIYQELQDAVLFWSLSQLDDERVMFRLIPETNEIKLATVTHFIEMQARLLRIWLFALLWFSLITYGFAVLFVKHSLKKLWNLARLVQSIDIHNLHTKIPLYGPKDDEIRMISSSLQSSLDAIKQQTDALKDFVSYASHELKTPLMAMHAWLAVAEKTKQFDSLIMNQKAQLKRMDELFEQLLRITKREFSKIERSIVNVVPLLQEVSHTVMLAFPEHADHIAVDIPDAQSLKTDPSVFMMIVSNLLTNACKYTPVWWIIQLSLDTQQLVIQDTGKWIASEHQEKIFQRFWKHDSEGFGLWLYLVKLLVEKHGRRLQVESEEGKGTTMRVVF